jgi:hypothetical protein
MIGFDWKVSNPLISTEKTMRQITWRSNSRIYLGRHTFEEGLEYQALIREAPTMPPQNDWAHTFMSVRTQCGTQRATPNGRSVFLRFTHANGSN